MFKKKKKFPIKYFRKDLFNKEDLLVRKFINKGRKKRRVIKPKMSVHIKTGEFRGKHK